MTGQRNYISGWENPHRGPIIVREVHPRSGNANRTVPADGELADLIAQNGVITRFRVKAHQHRLTGDEETTVPCELEFDHPNSLCLAEDAADLEIRICAGLLIPDANDLTTADGSQNRQFASVGGEGRPQDSKIETTEGLRRPTVNRNHLNLGLASSRRHVTAVAGQRR